MRPRITRLTQESKDRIELKRFESNFKAAIKGYYKSKEIRARVSPCERLKSLFSTKTYK